MQQEPLYRVVKGEIPKPYPSDWIFVPIRNIWLEPVTPSIHAEGSEWISVEEKMPAAQEDVLLYLPTLGIVNGLWISNKFKVYGFDVFTPREDVTHWMPLPAPPKPNTEVQVQDSGE
jgi:hypothetical protein